MMRMLLVVAALAATIAIPARADDGHTPQPPPEGSFAMVRAIRACGSPRLSIHPDHGHNAWDRAYDDPALYLWLLEQRNPFARPTPKDTP